MLNSLKNTQEFGRVYRMGRSYANRTFVMYVLKTEEPVRRLGISVSKKVGNSVVRHRIARLVREYFRLHGDISDSGLDIVVVARAGAKGISYFEAEEALDHLIKLHHLA